LRYLEIDGKLIVGTFYGILMVFAQYPREIERSWKFMGYAEGKIGIYWDIMGTY
jgi:hypothetical protein